MAYDEEDDLFAQEFDFVDEDDSELEDADDQADEDSDLEQEEVKKPAPKKERATKAKSDKSPPIRKARKPAASEEPDELEADREEVKESAEEQEPEPDPGPPADHVVFVYEFGSYKRTIKREFTDEDAIKFAEEYNRTAKPHGRRAVPAENTEEPDPQL